MTGFIGTLFLATAVVTAPPADDRFRLRIDAGLDHLRTPIVDGLKRRGPTIGAGLEYAFSPAYSGIWSIGVNSLGDDGSLSDADGLTIVSSSVGLRVVPFGENGRVTPYVIAGGGIVRARWRGSRLLTPSEARSETAWTIPLVAGVQWRLGEAPISALFIEAKHEFTRTKRVLPTGMEWWGIHLGFTLGRSW